MIKWSSSTRDPSSSPSGLPTHSVLARPLCSPLLLLKPVPASLLPRPLWFTCVLKQHSPSSALSLLETSKNELTCRWPTSLSSSSPTFLPRPWAKRHSRHWQSKDHRNWKGRGDLLSHQKVRRAGLGPGKHGWVFSSSRNGLRGLSWASVFPLMCNTAVQSTALESDGGMVFNSCSDT